MKRPLLCTLLLLLAPASSALAEDSLERIRERGVLTVCADPYNWPHSSSTDFPRGFDVEIFERIGSAHGLRTDVYWSDTGTRGGLGRAMRNSISKGRCDVFAGIAIIPDTVDELQEKDLVFSEPYLGLAYVPVLAPGFGEVRTIEDVAAKAEIGVAMSTAMDGYLIDNGIERELYLGNRRVLDGLAAGEIRAAFVWGPAIAAERRRNKNASFELVDGFDPPKALRWNVAAAIPGDQPNLIEFVNGELRRVLADGTADEVIEVYDFPYYRPFSE